MNRWILVIILVLVPSLCFGATLFDIDWATGTGTTTSVVSDGGKMTYVDNSPYDWYTVIATDGTVPGGRNFMRYTGYATDSGLMEATSGNQLGSPSDFYFRVWFRIASGFTGNLHAITMDDAYGDGGYEIALLDIRTAPSTSNYAPGVLSVAEGKIWRINNGINYADNTWHRWEVRVQGANGSSGSFTCLLDGVDVTENMQEHSVGAWLNNDNGSISINALNYIGMQSYSQGTIGTMVDLAGFKLSTDGWIGGDEATPVRKLNNVTGVRVTLH